MIAVYKAKKTMSAEERSAYRDLLKAKRTYEAGLAKLSEGTYKPASVGERYDIEHFDNGVKYVKASRKIMSNDKGEWEKAAHDFIVKDIFGNGESITVITDQGHLVEINKKDTAKELEKTKGLQYSPKENEEYDYKKAIKIKSVMAAYIDEIAKIADVKYEKVSDAKKDRKNTGKDGFVYGKAYFQDYDGEWYKVTLSVGLDKGKETAYNLNRIDHKNSKPFEQSVKKAKKITTPIAFEGVDNEKLSSHKSVRHGVDGDRITLEKENVNKEKQFGIIKKINPMNDEYHVGIRSVDDIKTWEEAMQDEESFVYGDFTKEDAQKALEKGKVTVYSSKPIEQGGFVSTSKNMAKDYAVDGKIYEQEVSLNDVAWINGDEGQYTGREFNLPNGARGSLASATPATGKEKTTDDYYQEMIDEYGAIEPGMNPRVDEKVPQSTDGNNKVRKTVRTVMEADNVSNDIKSAIKEDLAGDYQSGKLTYHPQSEKKTRLDT